MVLRGGGGGVLPLRLVPSPRPGPFFSAPLTAPTPSSGGLPSKGRPCVLCSFETGAVSKTNCEKFPERYSRAAGFRGSAGTCPGSTGPALPRQRRVLTLASGPFLSVGKDAVEDIGGSGKNRSPSGNHPKGSGHSCVACPCLQQGFGAGKNASQLWSPAGGRGQHIPGLGLSASQ